LFSAPLNRCAGFIFLIFPKNLNFSLILTLRNPNHIKIMKTIVITPKDQAEFNLLSDLLKRLKISTKFLNEEEKEDFALGVLTEEAAKGKKIPRSKIEKIFRGK